MELNTKFIGKLSIRSSLIIILMFASFFVVHGLIKRISEGGHLFEFLGGMIVAIVIIFIAAIPKRHGDENQI